MAVSARGANTADTVFYPTRPTQAGLGKQVPIGFITNTAAGIRASQAVVDSAPFAQPCPVSYGIAICFITLPAPLQTLTTKAILDFAQLAATCRGVKEVVFQFITFQAGGILALHAVGHRTLLELGIQVDVD